MNKLISNSSIGAFLLLLGIATTFTVASAFANNIADSVCRNTVYFDLCKLAFASIPTSSEKGYEELFDASIKFAMNHTLYIRASTYNYNLTFPRHDDRLADDCVELLDDTMEHLTNVLDPGASDDDVETWLSAALTNQETCLESLSGAAKEAEILMEQYRHLAQFISNSLALFTSMNRQIVKGGHRKLITSDGSPEWLASEDRKLLEGSREDIEPDAVVAMDGSGTHRSINEALASVSLAKGRERGGSKNNRRLVIHVKAGTYHEYVRIPTKQKNVMLIGDGKGKSFIIGRRSHGDGWSTYQSATVAAMGAGFIARDLTIINKAGPSKGQAVALRVGADRAVVYRCSIKGYQDTLYVHSNRQFHARNIIYGTVDFVFGNAAAILQSCKIHPRKPRPGQKNTITAQGRSDPNQNTGIIIQRCHIVATSSLAAVKKHAPTFLGRPWRKYSRVVVVQSYIDGSVHTDGWLPWSGSFALSTLYYGEYRNTGPGASTSGRVRWAGVHPKLSKSEATRFTVARFISGHAWLQGIGVSYRSGL